MVLNDRGCRSNLIGPLDEMWGLEYVIISEWHYGKQLRSLLCCALVFCFVRNRPWNFLPLKMGSIGCLETSVRNYHSTLHSIPDDRRLIVLFEKGTRRRVSRRSCCPDPNRLTLGIKWLECTALSALEWNMALWVCERARQRIGRELS
jgi:hypothetical protein